MNVWGASSDDRFWRKISNFPAVSSASRTWVGSHEAKCFSIVHTLRSWEGVFVEYASQPPAQQLDEAAPAVGLAAIMLRHTKTGAQPAVEGSEDAGSEAQAGAELA